MCVALSGGPDSVALTAAAVRAGLAVRALIVDHRLQPNSARVAETASTMATELGATPVVLPVRVGTTGGLEAAARTARYAALRTARDGAPVLLGHTMDDQAETVLLGLARGSGARSIAGMRAWSAPWGRPLLGMRRADTVAACAELGLSPYRDPHNSDPRFTRVRVRTEALPLLDEMLQGGVVQALARTADALRADNDALDAISDAVYRTARSADHDLAVAAVLDHPRAVRTRVVRRWLVDSGATEPTGRVIDAVEELLGHADTTRVAIGGTPEHRTVVSRAGAVLTVGIDPR